MTNEPLFPDESEEEKVEPEVQTESDSGDDGTGSPRRPTAVGAGSPVDDDEWSEQLARMRGGAPENQESEELTSWPIPNLKFTKIETPIPWSQQTPQRQKNVHDLVQYARNTIVKLHRQRANVAFVLLNDEQGVQSYLGTSRPGEGSHSYGMPMIAQADETLSAERVLELIDPLVGSAGVMVGIPSDSTITNSGAPVEQMLKVSSELNNFGIVILAIPIPASKVSSEELQVADQLQRAQSIESNSRKIKYYLDLQKSYLRNLQLGTTVGHWLVGGFYFAANKTELSKLESLIAANYQNEREQPAPLRTQELRGLESHVRHFGLLRNKHSGEVFQQLLEYRFLYPLNSHQLARYLV